MVTSVCFVLKTPLTNVAKNARIIDLTRFTTLEKKKPKRGLEMSANIAKMTWIFLAS